jgi:hypothetical protein
VVSEISDFVKHLDIIVLFTISQERPLEGTILKVFDCGPPMLVFEFLGPFSFIDL